MLVLARKFGQSIVLDGIVVDGVPLPKITIKLLSSNRLGIEAPSVVRVLRSELLDTRGSGGVGGNDRNQDPRRN